jgi:hypothetical protein
MGQETVRFSDLTDQLIVEDDALVRIVVLEHPELGDHPVEIEAHADEAKAIEAAALQVAIVDLYLPGEDEPRRVALDAGAFDKLATARPVSELLVSARPAKRGSKLSTGSVNRGERIDYVTLEHAGKPHKGKTTDAEKQLVREHLEEINERLAAEGLRTISLSDPSHVERYGLEELAAERAS